MTKRARSASQRPPRVYPLTTIARRRSADHIDCDDGSNSRPLCGFCAYCVASETGYRIDHPHTISREGLRELVSA